MQNAKCKSPIKPFFKKTNNLSLEKKVSFIYVNQYIEKEVLQDAKNNRSSV